MRRAPAEVRKLEPDPIYRSVLVTQVINKVLWRGKKGAARRIVYGSMDIVGQRTGSEPLSVLKRAVRDASVDRPIRFPSRFGPDAVRHSPSAGSSSSPASAESPPWRRASLERSSMRPTAPVPQ